MKLILILIILTALVIIFIKFFGSNRDESDEEAETYVCEICSEKECICHKEKTDNSSDS